MNRKESFAVSALVILACGSLSPGQASQAGRRADPAIWVREGFALSIAQGDIDRARFLAFAPDGTLFVSQPDSAQIQACRDEDKDGYYEKTAVFVKDHPTVQGLFRYEGWLWFTESGAIFRGHPFIVGNRIPRYEHMKRPDIVELAAKTIPPEWSTQAHWAPNAMVFYTGGQFPKEYRGDAFVAYHGSWNREKKAAHCVTRVLFDAGRPYGELVYVSFLTKDGKMLGRPVDVVVAPDGSLLISDDEGGRIYRLMYDR